MATKKPPSVKSIDELLKAMLVLSRTVSHVLETRSVEVANQTLSHSKTQVLRLLGQRGAQGATQIAHFLGVSKPAVTQIVDAMVRDKLVRRSTAVNDRRGLDVSLTAKGKTVFKQIRNEQRHLMRSALNQAGAAGDERWVRTLQDITGALARADRAFQHLCLQCGAHADGSCVLVGGDADCLFLRHRGQKASASRRKKPSIRGDRKA